MNKNTAIFSVFYPGVQLYIPEFLQSLEGQTDKNFTLFLINDGLPEIKQFFAGMDLSVKILNKTDHPAALRKKGIMWVVSEGAQNIIFADSDDYFSKNRVNLSKQLLMDYDVVFNELVLVGDKISQPVSMFGELFADGQCLTAGDIRAGNCIGLSNSGIRANKIPNLIAKIPDTIVAFDWAFFSLSLHEGAKSVFSEKTTTYYRQHGGNIASPCSFSDDQIMRGVMVKRDHYRFISEYYKEYSQLSEEYNDMLLRLIADNILEKKYYEAVRMNSSNNMLWWEPIKTFKELNI